MTVQLCEGSKANSQPMAMKLVHLPLQKKKESWN